MEPGPRPARGTRHACTSGCVPRTSEAREDLTADRVVPVAERRTDGSGMCRPGSAPKHLVLRSEEHLGVLAVRERHETRIRLEVTRRPLPDVTEHLMASVRAHTARVGTHGIGPETPLAQVGPIVVRRLVTPRVPALAPGRRVPRSGLLPLGFGREP